MTPATPRPQGLCSPGFTLIEVLIAIALVGVLLSAMFGFLFDMFQSRAKALEHVRQQQAATAIINRLEEELLTCIAGGEAVGGGVRGDNSNFRVLFRGVAAGLSSQGLEQVDVLGDLQLAEYRFDPDTLRVLGRRGSVRDRIVNTSAFSPLEGIVHKLRFRYHDGTNWQDSFDSLAAQRLPLAIEVAVWLRPLPGQSIAEESAESEPVDGATEGEFGGNFDDEASSLQSAAAFEQLPWPDRLRIIAIPDADDGSPRVDNSMTKNGIAP